MLSRISLLGVTMLCSASFARHDYARWDGNRISDWWDNRGALVSYQVTGNAGMEWPAGSGDTPVFAAGLWMVAGRVNGQVEVRSAAAEFTSEFEPGPAGVDGALPVYRIYSLDASLGPENPDWTLWPVEQGAPWLDVDGNSTWDPSVDAPDFRGDLAQWCVFNDLNDSTHHNLWSTEPLGIEVRTMLYGFSESSPLENTLIIQWNIRNVGGNDLDSVYVGLWNDMDVGEAINDYPGCRPDLDLVYHYVGRIPDAEYANTPPAAGFTLLQGPLVDSPGDTGWVDGTPVPDRRNLPLTSFTAFTSGPPFPADPETPGDVFFFCNGYHGDGTPILDPTTGEPGPLMFTGNPITGEGWLAADSTYPRDWRGVQMSGPLHLAPGEEQEIVYACVIAGGSSPLASLAALWEDVDRLREMWQDQFQGSGIFMTVTALNIPTDTESSGPFQWQFLMEDPAGTWSADRELIYSLGEEWSSLPLQEQGNDIWIADLPDFQVEATDTLAFYLQDSQQPDSRHWPSGAPWNHQLVILGPDTTAPVLAGLRQVNPVHHALDLHVPVQIDTVYDLRHDLVSVLLNWQVGGGSVHQTAMSPLDTNEVEWQLNQRFTGSIAGPAPGLGDTIRYWVTATDGSLNHNLAVGAERFFVAGEEQIIGDWDHAPSLGAIPYWDPFAEALLVPFEDGSQAWGQVIYENLLADGLTADTMSLVDPIDLSPLDSGWINIPMAWSIMNATNLARVQFHRNGVWTTVDSFRGFQTPDTFSYDLGEWLDVEDFRLRFVAERNMGGFLWVIDDPYLHSRADLVGADDFLPIPLSFALESVYPNPFNAEVTIRYALPAGSSATLRVFDVLGRERVVLFRDAERPGRTSIHWDGRDQDGRNLPSGLYFLRMESPRELPVIRKLLLLK